MLCECGCGKRTPIAGCTDRQKGWVKGQPLRFLKSHQFAVRKPPVREDHGYKTPCLIWQGKPSAQGYGRVTVEGHRRPAHVAAWERVYGPVPDGCEIDHLCYVRLCVDLTHLECVTKAENRRRSILRWR